MSDKTKSNWLIISSDSLWWYWLDVIFQTASSLWYDWIDLALWKNFDAWNIWYVKKLIDKYQIPVKVVQVSWNINKKELDYAIDLAREVNSNVITMNAPAIFNLSSHKFITKNLQLYKKYHSKIKFSIINPPRSSMYILPVPNYYFTNIVEVIKKIKAYIWFDVSNIDDVILESTFLRKIWNFLPYISVVYLSDKNKSWNWHIPLWDWVLKLNSIYRKFKQNDYQWDFSLKLEISKRDLSDLEKVEQILKKCRNNFRENYEELIIK